MRIATEQFVKLIAIVVCLLVTACAPRLVITNQTGDSAFAQGNLLAVPFVTNRNLISDGDANRYFDEGRGDLRAGYCYAAVAPDGRDYRPSKVELVPVDQLLSELDHDKGSVVVYVHGYNIGFKKSCSRAAALQSNLGLSGRLLLFSWPADGNILHYARDMADLEWSVLHLEKLIDDLVQRYGSQHVNLIGHSLGARGVVDALVWLAAQDNVSPINELILIAPDIDADVFRRDVAALRSVTQRITVYVSDHDRALRLSQEINGYPRLGEAGESLTIIDGVDTVDVSVARTNEPSGHIYHIYSQGVSEDMRALLGTDKQSNRYRRARAPSGDHWKLVLKRGPFPE